MAMPDSDVTGRESPCARCGHVPQGCPSCGRNDPFLGASLVKDGTRRAYCHTFSPTQPSCYMLEIWGE